MRFHDGPTCGGRVTITLPHDFPEGDLETLAASVETKIRETGDCVTVTAERMPPPPKPGESRVTVTSKHSTCSHDKVYSGEHNWTLTPQWWWICGWCFATGTDSLSEAPPVDFDRFVDLLACVDPEGAESRRRMREMMKR